MLRVRPCEEADHPALAGVMAEMQAHYHVLCPPDAEIRAGLANRPAGTELLVSEHDGAIVGFAAFSAIYPGPGLRPGCFLKEIYVAEAARGLGAGKALLAELARLALERGLGRIDWTAARDDERLLRFYESLGAKQHPEKVFFRLTGEGLARLAER
ncbi:L-amino acid N-acyltransferase YncA [Bosea sp. 62]|uniref:GNAT family N-acetyltransferase n=1 Tax=unclassified Bosea (in: a-proteobacteria) TaxID=2653178 RepID=UPI001251E761|nr:MULTISPECIES: GNAT family N-acetyltransferase [unclassified Bosea (in: a-proteobacteria)]CAD5289189.1 L-amino acid N-acyltransferase YncA [Bosea sp. 7B]CAD5300312.1 L-amino acid N-acyltransferase YncA [Bosea sp. 21B]CAD5300871.1 L-amino acid N-acyltransferase YncA [Bosea sp. 46]VVT62013.1 Ribosomal protein S18 acetylase RimI [Bosea sp. EC-HK365B]VXB50376.1 L-amino acid N-acyltransferase YncA [Bosea sp. 125]